ncbi:MAG: glycosyltransferase [Cyanobacteria bacterium P01_E01_bin.42]
MQSVNYRDRCAVIIPYKDCSTLLAQCLDSLLSVLPESAIAILVDDGSAVEASADPALCSFLQDRRIRYLRHPHNRGPAAARNTGICWCQEREIKLAILLDSDCLVLPNFVETHCNLHEKYPDVVCIGGAIIGLGRGLWAKLDGLMSWFTSIPNLPLREVKGIYHIPTTNMSLKLDLLLPDYSLFDTRFKTGEDVAFCKKLQSGGAKMLFSPQPVIQHLDRTRFKDFLRHQYRWGLHTYVVRFGDRSWGIFRRLLLALTFIVLLPAYAIVASAINMIPWLKQSLMFIQYCPLVLFIYLIKGIAVVVGICFPSIALYPVHLSSSFQNKKLK